PDNALLSPRPGPIAEEAWELPVRGRGLSRATGDAVEPVGLPARSARPCDVPAVVVAACLFRCGAKPRRHRSDRAGAQSGPLDAGAARPPRTRPQHAPAPGLSRRAGADDGR